MIGVVAPTGTDLDAFCGELTLALRRVNYDSELVHLSQLLKNAPKAPWNPIPDQPEEDRIRKLMDAGDQLCRDAQRLDGVALLGIADINRRHGSPPVPKKRTAFIIRSLKRPAEVATFRQIYGPWFLLFGALTPREQYKDLLKGRMKSAQPLWGDAKLEAKAAELIERDESGGEGSTQNVSATFHLADAFIDASTEESLQSTMQRTVDLVFGDRFITPSRDEYGMFHAHATALRSAAPSRQVGATLTGDDGEVVTMGMNEVPKAGGGFVWDGEKDDNRDHQLPEKRDPSLLRRRTLIADMLTRISPWLEASRQEKVKEKIDQTVDEAWETVLKDSQVRDLIEFQRAQHAEAAALADAARRGVSIRNCTLYSTTYPCHLCAKEIVSSGIKRVVFLEPYPKSRATDFYPGSITHKPEEYDDKHVLFEPFKGVAPRRYLEFFTAEKAERVTDEGEIVDFEKARELSIPRLGQPREQEPSYLTVFARETVAAGWILDKMEALYG